LTSNYLIHDTNTTKETIETTVTTWEEVTTTEIVPDLPLQIQTGANKGQFLEIVLTDARSSTIGVDDTSLMTGQGAQQAIEKIENSIGTISSERSKWGAYDNALQHIHSNVTNSEVNLSEAESRISDTDMALEMTKYMKRNILNQSATAMLAQANQLRQGILQLLQ
jgi:flagellin